MKTMATGFFLKASHGQLFALYYPPLSGNPHALVVHVPAFAEEMNKSRRMVALQAAELSRNNIGVLVLDLYGTGDSEGLMQEASREIWRDDIHAAVNWLTQQCSSTPVYLWGLRFGCALAVDYVSQAKTEVQGLLFWQPLLSAKMMLTQFLRLRVASAMTSQNSDETSPKTTKDLFSQLEYGIAVEVAGYLISPELYTSLSAIDKEQPWFRESQSVYWLDFAGAEATQPSAVNRKIINHWNQQGHSVQWKAVSGDRFWATQEIAVAPKLISATTQLLSAVTA